MTGSLPPRRPWHRAATTALFLGNGLLLGSWAASLTRLKEAQALSDAALGTLLLAFGLGAVAAMPLTGRVAARIGAARVAGVAGLILAVLFPLPTLVSGWPVLLAVAVALGAVNGTMDVAMNAQASLVERAWGVAVMSSFHAGWSVGGLAGAALAGVLAASGWGLPAAFALPAAILAIMAACGLTLHGREAAPRRGAAFVLPSRALAGICALAALCFAAEGAVADWLGIYLRDVLGTDASWAASAFAAYAMAMAVGRLGGDAVVRRLGPVWVVRLGSLLAALGLALTLTAPGPLLADAGLVLVGLGLSNIVPVVFSAGGQMQGSEGVAMAATTGYAGLLIAPPVLGHISDAFGLPQALLLVLAGIAVMSALASAVTSPPVPYVAVRAPR